MSCIFLVALVHGIQAADYAIGRPKANQELVRVVTKFTPFHDDIQSEIKLEFNFDGKNVVSSLTQAFYTLQMVRALVN